MIVMSSMIFTLNFYVLEAMLQMVWRSTISFLQNTFQWLLLHKHTDLLVLNPYVK